MGIWAGIRKWVAEWVAPRGIPFPVVFARFQSILDRNNRILELIADLGDKLGGSYVFDRQYILSSSQKAAELVSEMIRDLNTMASRKYLGLYKAFERIHEEIEEELAGRPVIPQTDYVLPYEAISRDLNDVVGSKNANLAEVKNLLGLPVPDGFAVTTRAFQCFMEHNLIWDRILSLAVEEPSEDALPGKESQARIQELIMAGTVPAPVDRALRSAVERLYSGAPHPRPLLAVRSSARGEDSELSFAGQFESFLNEPPERLSDCYKRVLASIYSGTALEYRRQAGLSENEVVMAVGCQLMVDARVSGVLYSLDPQAPEREVMLINATWGLGVPLVNGRITGDQYTVGRRSPHQVLALNVVRKKEMLSLKEGGGSELQPVPEELQTRPCLSNKQLKDLAHMALSIERYFKRPQDIEWVLDREANLFIVQARPLNIRAQVARLVCDIASALEHYPVIFQNKGTVAQRGIGVGKVFTISTEEDLDSFPPGAILVAKHTSPRLARAMGKANGIITDVGSPTGHMATIAREFRVPTIVNTGVATRLLHSGQEITLDAEQNVVYEGTVRELCYYEFTEEHFEETYEYRLLRRILKKIAPLNLLDPYDKNFTPAACQTYHDITRFIHEKAVEELIDLKLDRRSEARTRKLKFAVPLGLVLLDIGGGLNAPMEAAEVEPEQVTSVPMRALLAGMVDPGMWTTEPMSVDFGSFMSSLTRTFSSSLAAPRYLGHNLAVISREYVNLSLRLGYHFNVIDSYISEKTNDNYAYFRFLGGVTDISRRSRRANFLAQVLGKYDFRIDVRGDLVVARIKKLPLEGMMEKLHILGRLISYTRQLDVKMLSDEHVNEMTNNFLQLVETQKACNQAKGEHNGDRQKDTNSLAG